LVRIETDQVKRERQVAEITDHFRESQEKSQRMRGELEERSPPEKE